MRNRSLTSSSALAIVGLIASASAQQPSAPAAQPSYNFTKQQLAAGKKIGCATIYTPDADTYCAIANSGATCTWIEMQHSVMTYGEIAAMVRACPRARATPMLRVPDATEADIQKATDLGVLGIIVPTVDTPEKAATAVRYSKYPPTGRRSQGTSQARTIWGDHYRQSANDNMMVIVQIETVEGVNAIDKIAAVPGVDVVFAASTDIGSFSGHPYGGPQRKGDAVFEGLITKIHDATLKAGKILGGPIAWIDRPDFRFLQAPAPSAFIGAGASTVLGTTYVPPAK
jgi:2-keto-3-deoxy-L-rhamnonate aldolase RhmA